MTNIIASITIQNIRQWQAHQSGRQKYGPETLHSRGQLARLNRRPKCRRMNALCFWRARLPLLICRGGTGARRIKQKRRAIVKLRIVLIFAGSPTTAQKGKRGARAAVGGAGRAEGRAKTEPPCCTAFNRCAIKLAWRPQIKEELRPPKVDFARA